MQNYKKEIKHTPTPWMHDETRRYKNEHGVTVCPIDANGFETIAEVYLPDDDDADLRRIIACVNACEGIPTSLLEQGVVKAMREAVRKLLFEIDFYTSREKTGHVLRACFIQDSVAAVQSILTKLSAEEGPAK